MATPATTCATRRRAPWWVAAGLLLLLGASPIASAEPLRYDVVDEGSLVYALVYKAGAASAVAHDHAIRATGLTGTVTWDEDDPGSASIRVELPTAGLDPDPDDLRARTGLPGTVKAKDRATILGHITDAGQLDAGTWPTISFVSTSVSAAEGTDAYAVEGTLTVRGVSRPVRTVVTVTPEGDGLRASGRFTLVQSDFGYAPYTALLGALKVKDPVDVVLDVQLAR